MDEAILGFDVRIWPAQIMRAYWPPYRRSMYLIKTSVLAPLSVDQAVWPSLEESISRSNEWLTSIQGSLPLYHNLNDLLNHKYLKKGCTIAVSLLIQNNHDNAAYDTMHNSSRVIPDRVEGDWIKLGYDVADEGLISGLMNCGYDETRVDSVRQYWTPHLNADHLFDLQSLAVEFAEFSNSRVPEHAPFFVYGVYQIRTEPEKGP